MAGSLQRLLSHRDRFFGLRVLAERCHMHDATSTVSVPAATINSWLQLGGRAIESALTAIAVCQCIAGQTRLLRLLRRRDLRRRRIEDEPCYTQHVTINKQQRTVSERAALTLARDWGAGPRRNRDGAAVLFVHLEEQAEDHVDELAVILVAPGPALHAAGFQERCQFNTVRSHFEQSALLRLAITVLSCVMMAQCEAKLQQLVRRRYGILSFEEFQELLGARPLLVHSPQRITVTQHGGYISQHQQQRQAPELPRCR